jgi:hypothetical protein
MAPYLTGVMSPYSVLLAPTRRRCIDKIPSKSVRIYRNITLIFIYVTNEVELKSEGTQIAISGSYIKEFQTC